MQSVRFASTHYFDADHGVFRFTAFHHHQIIPCAIKASTLCEQFGADPDAPVANFVRQRYLVERLVEELILEERFEADGSILICSPDCRWLHDASHRPIRGAQAPAQFVSPGAETDPARG
jgi:hypothetical protein